MHSVLSSSHSARKLCFLALTLLLLYTVHLFGDSVWDGSTGDTFWGTADNWNTPPVNGSDLRFTGSDLLTVNNGALNSVGDITFSNTPFGYTVSGDPFTLNGRVHVNTSETPTIENNIVLATNNEFSVPNGALILNGYLSGNGGGIYKIGSGTLGISGSADYTGDTHLAVGSIYLNGPNAFMNVPSVYVGKEATENAAFFIGLGAGLNSAALFSLGESAGSHGSLLISEAGTAASLSILKVGDAGTGSLIASDTATVLVGAHMDAGYNYSSHGVVTIQSGADMTINGNANIAGFGSGALTVSGSGSTLTTNQSTLKIAEHSSAIGLFTLDSGAQYYGDTAGSAFVVGDYSGAQGFATITGPGTTGLLNDAYIAASGIGSLNLSDTATVVVQGNLYCGDTATANGYTQIESGANLVVSGETGIGSNGAGNLTVAGINSAFTGSDLYLGKNASGNGVLTIGNDATVSASGKIYVGKQGQGRVNLYSSDGIINATDIQLEGGTFSSNGFDQATGGMGALSINADSIIDMGFGDSILNWSLIDENIWTGTLKIYNWTGTVGAAGGSDQLLFQDVTGFDKFDQVRFYSDNGSTSLADSSELVPVGGGIYELLPAAALPDPPEIVQAPNHVLIVAGGTAILNLSATGDSITYQWYQGESGDTSSPIPAATADSFNTGALSDSTSYWVRITNGGGYVDSETVNVTVDEWYYLILSPDCDGQWSITNPYSVSVPYSWEMYRSTEEGVGVVAPFATVTFSTTLGKNKLRLFVDGRMVATEKSISDVCVGSGPSILTQPSDASITSGNTANLSAVVDGTTTAFTWYKGLRGETSNVAGSGIGDTVTLTTASLIEDAAYWVRVFNSGGDYTDSVTAYVSVSNVNSRPKISKLSDIKAYPGVETSLIRFTVKDKETPTDNLIVTAVSDNLSLIPNENLILTGDAIARDLKILIPSDAVPGTVTITVTVSDGQDSKDSSFDVEIKEAPTVAVTRKLPNVYNPGHKHRVRFKANPKSGITSFVVTENVPVGWTVEHVSPGGSYDSNNHVVTFGPFLNGERRTFSYKVVAPLNASGTYTFTGEVASNAGRKSVLGDSVIGEAVKKSYNEWIEEIVPGYVSGPQPDLDVVIANDGITNLVRYSMGITPNSNAVKKMPRGKFGYDGADDDDDSDDDKMCMVFKRSKLSEGLSYVVENSDDLVNWSEADIETEIIGEEGDCWIIQAKTPINLMKSLRLKVSTD